MKLLLLFSLLLTPLFAYKTQIVLGTYLKKSSVKVDHLKFKSMLNYNTELKNILRNNNLEAVRTRNGRYYILTIGPFREKTIRNSILYKIKNTQFSDAFIIYINSQKSISNQIIEQAEKTTKIDEKTVKPMTEPIKQSSILDMLPMDQTKLKNILLSYLYEIIASLSVFILLIFFLFRKK